MDEMENLGRSLPMPDSAQRAELRADAAQARWSHPPAGASLPPPPHPKNAASPHNRCAPTRRCHACAAVDVPLYHERQHLSLCAVHALNNIFGNQPGAQASRAPLRGSTVGVRPERLRPPLTSPVTARRPHRGTGISHWAPMPAVESPMLPAPCGSPPCLSRAAEPRLSSPIIRMRAWNQVRWCQAGRPRRQKKSWTASKR